MPKLKTKRSAAKRITATGTGKLRRNKGWKRHLLEWKPSKRKRQLRNAGYVPTAHAHQIEKLLPYKD